jgi:hypothetical protein
MHPKTNLTSLLFCSVTLVAVTGCGESQAEKAAKEKERQRLQMEQQALEQIQKENKAITENNKKLGRPPPSLDIGLPKETASKDASPPPKK